jgi:nucleoside-diphosphate-sugar epimerase
MLITVHVLVTGAAGFIGSHVCEALLARGHFVTGVDAFVANYPRETQEANLAGLVGTPAFRLVEGDLRVADLSPLLEGIDAVIHEAAMPGLVRSWTDFDAYVGCNIVATQRLLSACAARGLRRFVHASTSSVYGEVAVGDESLPTSPVSPYGITKLAAEHLVHAYARTSGLRAIVLRYFSIYGPRQRPDMAYQAFIERLMRAEPIDVYGDGEQSRSNTYIDDCVAATAAALESDVEGVVNIGGGESITLNTAIDVIARALGVEPVVRYHPARPGDQRHTRADWSHAAQVLAYRPAVAARDGLERQVAWNRRTRES